MNQKLKMSTTLLISIHHCISSASEHQLCPCGTDQKPHIRCALSASPSLYFLVQPLAFNCPDPPLSCPSVIGPSRPPASAPDASSAFFPPRLLSALPVTLLLAHFTVGWGHSDLHPCLLQAPGGGQASSRPPRGTLGIVSAPAGSACAHVRLSWSAGSATQCGADTC